MPDNRFSNPVLDEGWLQRAAWWVRHRAQLRNIGAGIVLVVSGSLILYSLYVWIDYWGLSRARDQQTLSDLTQNLDYAAINPTITAAAIQTPIVVVLPGSQHDNHWDVLTKFVNPNEKYLATLTYQIVSSDGITSDPQTVTLLNNEEYFSVTKAAAASPGATVRADFLNIQWQRLHDPQVLDDRKPKFTVSDVKFLSPAELQLSGDLNVSQVRFTVANESVSSFWSVDFTIVLLQGQNAVAASTTTLDRFMGGEQRDVTINLFANIPTVTDVLVVPHVNVADDSVFMNTPGPSIKF